MTSSRPYLVRALYEWIVDNECTPHLLVNVDYPDVQVPSGFASDGQIVLNISPNAVRNLDMDNEAVRFEGRFGGIPHSLYVPIGSVMAIYAKENGQGMMFEMEPPETPDPEGESSTPEAAAPRPAGGPSGRPSLKVVK